MSGPEVKTLIEQIYNEKLVTHQPISDRDRGFQAEPGLQKMWGIDISDSKAKQRIAHVIDTFFPLPQQIIRLAEAKDKMPGFMAAMKFMFGTPLRVDDPILAEFLEMNSILTPINNKIRKLQLEYAKKENSAPESELNDIMNKLQKLAEQKSIYQAIKSEDQSYLKSLKALKYQLAIAKYDKDELLVKQLEDQMEMIYNQYRENLKLRQGR